MDNSEERLARLEREMAILRTEFARLREQLGAPAARASAPGFSSYTPPSSSPPPSPERPQSSPPPPPPPPRSAPPPSPAPPPRDYSTGADRSASIEQVIGRYGMVALGALLALITVGTVLNYAIRNGLLGPAGRVMVGYAAAAGVAYGGFRLRIRGTREYGNILIALSLGIVHLVCWSAGPLLHVMPSIVALGIGFLTSVVLAEFALRHDEEMLCAVGFGGAMIAPFVASDSGGSHIALAGYGMIVIALAGAALGSRQWRAARAVTMWSIVMFTLAAGAGPASQSPPIWIATRLWVITPLAILLAAIPFTHAANRRALLRVSAGALILGALFRADKYYADVWAMALTLVGTIVAIGALEATRGGTLERTEPMAVLDGRLIDKDALLDAFILPIGLFIATIAAAPDALSVESAAIAAAFAALAVIMTHRARGEPEGGHYAGTASLIALWIVPAAFVDQHLARVAGTVAMGVLLIHTARKMDRVAFIAGSFGAFLLASIWSLVAADTRHPYEYPPFMTLYSLAIASAVLGWLAAVQASQRADFMPQLDRKVRGTIRETFITGAAVTAFLWGATELGGAWSRTAATALLIIYYASTGALMIHLGRVRQVRHLRLMGMGVALWAVGKALVEAFGIPNAAVRITVFFAVSVFLLAVGYWYRRDASPGAA